MALPGSPDSRLPLGVCCFSLLDLQASTAEAPRVQRTRHLEPGRGRQQRHPGESASEMPGLKPNPGRTSRDLDFHAGEGAQAGESLKEKIDSHDPNPFIDAMPSVPGPGDLSFCWCPSCHGCLSPPSPHPSVHAPSLWAPKQAVSPSQPCCLCTHPGNCTLTLWVSPPDPHTVSKQFLSNQTQDLKS